MMAADTAWMTSGWVMTATRRSRPPHAHKHKTSNTRRAWRKLHLAIDGEGFIIASELTGSGVDDASGDAAMIERIDADIARFTADEGARRPSEHSEEHTTRGGSTRRSKRPSRVSPR
jgi:hypothetical protein